MTDEGQALTMQEVDLRVQGSVGDISDFVDTPKRALVYQELENQPVLVRLLLPEGRIPDPVAQAAPVVASKVADPA